MTYIVPTTEGVVKVKDGPHQNHEGGIHVVYRCVNGYGASVIRTPWSYGGDEGKYELAVIQFGNSDEEYYIVYDTPITNDVEGYLSHEEVVELVLKIKEL